MIQALILSALFFTATEPISPDLGRAMVDQELRATATMPADDEAVSIESVEGGPEGSVLVWLLTPEQVTYAANGSCTSRCSASGPAKCGGKCSIACPNSKVARCKNGSIRHNNIGTGTCATRTTCACQ